MAVNFAEENNSAKIYDWLGNVFSGKQGGGIG